MFFYYKPITLLELKMLRRSLKSVAKIVLGAKQICAVKERTIQRNLHLICTNLDGIKYYGEIVLINFDHSKPSIGSTISIWLPVLHVPGFKCDFFKWNNLLYRSPSAVSALLSQGLLVGLMDPWFELGLLLKKNRPEVQAKVGTAVQIWFRSFFIREG